MKADEINEGADKLNEDKMYFYGKSLRECTREELYDCIYYLHNEMTEYQDKFRDWQIMNPIDYLNRKVKK